MRSTRTTIAGLMVGILVVSLMLGIFRGAGVGGLVALLPFGMTAGLARLGSTETVRRWAFGIGAVGTLLIPFLAAITINHALWGYWISRPALDDRIVAVERVETVTRVETPAEPGAEARFSGAPVDRVDRFIQVHPQEGDYYVLEGRILRALRDRGTFPTEPPMMPVERLNGLYTDLLATGQVEDGEPGYEDAKKLDGIAVEAIGSDGRPLVFVGVRGGEVSNDHHPYYEFLFTRDAPGKPLRLLSFQRFYYDVAGIEGAEFPVFWPFFAFLSLIPTIPIEGALLWFGRRSGRNREPG